MRGPGQRPLGEIEPPAQPLDLIFGHRRTVVCSPTVRTISASRWACACFATRRPHRLRPPAAGQGPTREPPIREGSEMAAYTCDKCGMSVGSMTCGECGQELVHETLTKGDGSSVHVSKCPGGHGMVKSPMCCGQDMACAV